VLHKTLEHLERRENRLLFDGLDRHEAHVRSAQGLADRFGVRDILLIGGFTNSGAIGRTVRRNFSSIHPRWCTLAQAPQVRDL
jgi:hypothetical protein